MLEDQSDGCPGGTTVGIIFNAKHGTHGDAPDAEAEYDNPATVTAIRKALDAGGYRTVLLEGDAGLVDRLKEHPVDIAFNIAEGVRGRGREAEVPAVLNMMGIPFTGSDETTLCLALDKALAKRLLSTYGIRTPAYAVVSSEAEIGSLHLPFPVIVKPDSEGSSKGIPDACVAAGPEELRRILLHELRLYREPMLVEEYLPGREFTVGLLGNGKDVRVFPPMEIVFRYKTDGGYHVYSYDVKQNYQKYISYECPARLSSKQEAEIKDMALGAFQALRCRDFSRADFRLSADGTPYFIEINPLPGLAPGYSDFPMLAEFCGVSYQELILSILRAALERFKKGGGQA